MEFMLSNKEIKKMLEIYYYNLWRITKEPARRVSSAWMMVVVSFLEKLGIWLKIVISSAKRIFNARTIEVRKCHEILLDGSVYRRVV